MPRAPSAGSSGRTSCQEACDSSHAVERIAAKAVRTAALAARAEGVELELLYCLLRLRGEHERDSVTVVTGVPCPTPLEIMHFLAVGLRDAAQAAGVRVAFQDASTSKTIG